ncbi:MAG: hypothetical protein HKN23_04330 [Verrucomicrobiales bacterium]|nr:hypothetical protein [Verrucomicrobiales bacterium]
MPIFLPETGDLLIFFPRILGQDESLPLPPNGMDWTALAHSVLLFFGGLYLGFLIFRNRKNGNGNQSATDSAESFQEKNPDEAQAFRDQIEAEFERSRAELQGEMDAAKFLISQQRSEIERRDEKLALTQSQLEEKQRRVADLVALTEANPDRPGDHAALAHAHASLIQLIEVIKSERQRIGSGISRLEQIESRVQEQNDQVWEGVNELGPVRRKLAEARNDKNAAALAKRLRKLEDQLRVHHQNATGCVSGAVEMRKRLQQRQGRLRDILQPVQCVEKRIDEMVGNMESNPKPDTEEPKWLPEVETATGELEITKKQLSGFQNGLHRELAEIDGRLDWLSKDSARGFLKELDSLKDAGSVKDVELTKNLSRIERKLAGIRSSLTHSAELLPHSEIGTKTAGGPQRISAAFDSSIEALKTVALTPSADTSQVPELDSSHFQDELEELKGQLESERSEAAALKERLESETKRLSKLEGDLKRTKAGAEGRSSSSSFMRRLLGLGPSRREIESRERAEQAESAAAKAEAGLEPEGEAEDAEIDRDLTAPQRSIEDLKSAAAVVETASLSSSGGGNGNGNGDASGEIEELRKTLSEKDSTIRELKQEIRQLTRSIPEGEAILSQADTETSASSKKLPDVNVLPLTPERFSGEQGDGYGVELDAGDLGPIPLPTKGDDREPQSAAVGETPSSDRETVVFRSDDPKIWNTDFEDSNGNFAIPLKILPADVEFIRIRRLDTGDSVTLPITREELIVGDSRTGTMGWSGRAENYFGSVHLGIFDETVPHEVETKFGAGGWGFGHRYEIGSGQAYAWAGREISRVKFEIIAGHAPAGRPAEEMSSSRQPEMEQTAPLASVAPTLAVEVESLPLETETVPVEEPRESAISEIPAEGLILFRSNIPELWNTTIYRGGNHRAREIADLPDTVEWLEITRMDTGESMGVPVTRQQLLENGDGAESGFNGTNEIFYEARHLGVFDAKASLDLEVKFTYGGWGFGHEAEPAEGSGESQASGWAGKVIDPDTVFEIRVFSEQPPEE